MSDDVLERYGFVPANHTKPQFFPVSVRPVYDERGMELPGWKRVQRDDTGTVLAVHTDSYRLITNEEAFGAFEDALRHSSLDLNGMRIATDYANGGARVFRQYLLPAHMVEVAPRVRVALRLLMFNSYDGTVAFKGMSGAFNFVCANTCVVGKEFASFKMKHINGSVALDLHKVATTLVHAAEQFEVEAQRFRDWHNIRISPIHHAEQVERVFRAIPQSTTALVEHLTTQWLRAATSDGPNNGETLWALYNVLTAWATHAVPAKGGQSTRFDRELRVAKAIESDAWAALTH